MRKKVVLQTNGTAGGSLVLNRVVISIACVYDNLSKTLISEFGLHIVAWVSFSAPNPYPNLFDPRLLQIHIQICWIVV
jgi:hypothetical protein